MIKMQLRAYKQEDLESVRAMAWEDQYVQEDILKCLSEFQDCGIVAELGEKVVGVGVFTGPHQETSMTFYVTPAHRRKGIGTQLVKALEEKMKGLEVQRVVVDFKENREIKLFMEKKAYVQWFRSHFMTYEGTELEQKACEIIPYEDSYYEACQKISSIAFHEMRLRVGLESSIAQPSEEGREHYRNNAEDIFILKEGEEVIGCYGVADDELDWVTVDTNKQGQGYGKQLVTHAINTCLERGHEKIVLWCVEKNTARSLYEKVGFKSVRIHELMYHLL